MTSVSEKEGEGGGGRRDGGGGGVWFRAHVRNQKITDFDLLTLV